MSESLKGFQGKKRRAGGDKASVKIKVWEEERERERETPTSGGLGSFPYIRKIIELDNLQTRFNPIILILTTLTNKYKYKTKNKLDLYTYNKVDLECCIQVNLINCFFLFSCNYTFWFFFKQFLRLIFFCFEYRITSLSIHIYIF